MFDLGFSELLLVAVVALIVLGPERLPRAARFAGLWLRRARAQWYSVKSELERELASEELRRSLQASRETMQELGADLRATGDDARREFESLRDQAHEAVLPAEARAPPAVTPTDQRDDEAPAPPPAQDPGIDDDRR